MSPGMGGYTSITGAVRKMAAEEGIRGFYKGLYPNLLKVPPLLPLPLLLLYSSFPCLRGRVRVRVLFVWVLTLW
jgi:hypothetical protein